MDNPDDARRPAPSRRPPRSPQPRFNPLRLLAIGIGLLAVAGVSATTGALLALTLADPSFSQRALSRDEQNAFSDPDESISSSGLQMPQLTRPVNILILGIKVVTSDVDDNLTQEYGYHALVNSFEGLSDTMMLARFDPKLGKMTMLSIPRDTRTYVEGLGTAKINAANSYGGPALAARSTSDLLEGVPIDRYVRINVQGVEKLIDALGGLTLYVPRDMKYTDESQHLYINLKQGRQHLDGDRALQFLRFRYDEYGDIGRVQRQQMALRAFKEQLLSPATLLRLPKVMATIRENLDTNLSLEEIAALAGFASNIERQDVQFMMLPGEFGDLSAYGGVSYWLPHPRRIRRLMASHFEVGMLDGVAQESGQESGSVRVAIQNSTGSDEAIAAVQSGLRDQGYRNFFTIRPWSEPLTTTRIVAQNGNVELAEQVRDALGFGEVRVESTGYLDSDVTIQVGVDWTAAAAAAAAALDPLGDPSGDGMSSRDRP
jgi:LCP family protein required for cell wall assembly